MVRYVLGPSQEPLPGKAWARCKNCWLGRDQFGPRGAVEKPSTRALVRGSAAGAGRLERRSLVQMQRTLSKEEQLLLTFSFSFKAEMNCSSCPEAVCTRDTTFMKQYPLAAAAVVHVLVLQFHSLFIPLLSVQTPYPEREDKCVGV